MLDAIGAPLVTLLSVQILMGGLDILYHHELTEGLSWRPSAARELKLHGTRNALYAVIFITIGYFEPHGVWAQVFAGILLIEILITLADFVEEDRSRRLPSTERILHTILAINYGAILALFIPVLHTWSQLDSILVFTGHGLLPTGMAFCALGVFVCAIRDFWRSIMVNRLQNPNPGSLTDILPERRHFLITGGTGFVGRRLIASLLENGHEVTVLTRDIRKAAALELPVRTLTTLETVANNNHIDVIINLAGEPIAGGRWTEQRRQRIYESRIGTTSALVDLMNRLEHKPEVFLSASAIGWYGPQGDDTFPETEEGSPSFTRLICQAWEAEARRAEALGIRTCLLRIGLVLDRDGGILSGLLPVFELGLGGPIGNGRQWMSWIHRDDLVRLIAHAIVTKTVTGPINAVAPNPVRNREFAATLACALNRPAVIPLPALPLKIALGTMAEEIMLSGQRVIPWQASASQFEFIHRTLESALQAAIAIDTQINKSKFRGFTDRVWRKCRVSLRRSERPVNPTR